MNKQILTLDIVKTAKPEHIAVLNVSKSLQCPQNPELYPSADLKRQGFYFFIDKFGTVVSRFYMGRRRSKCDFENGVVRMIREKRSVVCRKLFDAVEQFDIYYVPSENMKPLTTAVGKGKIAKFVTRSHNDRYQNLEEMNRMLNDHFTFTFQKF